MAESDAVGRVSRWVGAGGSWQVVSRAETRVTIALCTCDRGEEMARFTSGDAKLLELIGDRRSSED